MLPSSDRITSGDPALAQAIAHSLLMGLSRCLVKAHAESNTYPFTVTGWELSVATPGIANPSTRTNPTLTRHTYFIRRLPMTRLCLASRNHMLLAVVPQQLVHSPVTPDAQG